VLAGPVILSAVELAVAKYSIEAAVEGELYLEAPKTTITVHRSGIRYEFRADENGRLNIIAVILHVAPVIAATMHATFGPKSSMGRLSHRLLAQGAQTRRAFQAYRPATPDYRRGFVHRSVSTTPVPPRHTDLPLHTC
jgi:hypothetical protein